MSEDPYLESAEMYELLSESHWQERYASVRNALAGSAETIGSVLDIGAGTGRGTELVASAMPGTRLLAIEPSTSMRIGLMTRLLASAELRRRVTVSNKLFQDADLPSRFAAAFAFGCIGFFGPEDRQGFWQRLREGLDPNGFVFVDVMRIDRPQHVPDMRVVSATAGNQRYDIWLQGEPGKDDQIVWTMRFEIIRDERVVREFAIKRAWHAFSLAQLAEEAAAAGFAMSIVEESPVPAGIFRLRASR